MASLKGLSWWPVLLGVFTVVIVSASAGGGGGGNPTAGFVKVDLTDANFKVQSPYNVPESQRFRFSDGVRRFWVYDTDKPFDTSTHTNPRTEVRIQGHDYSSGVWQFEGYGYIPSGTSGTSVMQIHNDNGDEHATIFMLHVYNGVLHFYDRQTIESNIYDRWFQLNVVHDTSASTVVVYIDGLRKFSTSVIPARSYYLKFGVYMQHRDWSNRMESRWTNVTVYTKA